MMSISDIISARNINEIVHFTTNKGLIGVLATKFLKARSHLKNEQYLEFILHENSKFRSDLEWVDYISLSVTRMNTSFFNQCTRWHADIQWCAICISASVLGDKGVVFTTTNNIYRDSVIRTEGPQGLEAIFAPSISGRYGLLCNRGSAVPDNVPTDIQAEVLYPNQISIDYIQRIVVRTDNDADEMCGITNLFLHSSHIPVIVDPDFFK